MLRTVFTARPFRRLAGLLLLAGLLAGRVTAQSDAFTVVGWGDNSTGQLSTPAGLMEVAAVAAGDGHVAALRSDGQLVAWGKNDFGQSTVPQTVAGSTATLTFTAVVAGPRHTFALSSAGLLSWGAVTAVPDGAQYEQVKALAAGGDFNLILLGGSGRVSAAGGNAYGQSNVPVAAQSKVVAIAAGDGHALALKADGTLVAWGRNDFGQATVPAGAVQIFAIAAGRDFSVALRNDGSVLVWGHGADSYLQPPAAASGAGKVAAGADFIAVETDTALFAWGASGAPTQVPADFKRTTQLVAGAHAVFGVRAPYFTKFPGMVQVRAGEAAELSAEVSYSTGLTAHWTELTASPQSLTLKFTNVQHSSAGTYTLEVNYATGYSMTATGILNVLTPPQVSNGPAGTGFARENESATFFFDVEGTGPFTFQWRKDGADIPGATTRIWILQPVKPSDAGAYTCRITNVAGSIEASARTLVVLPPKNGRERTTTPVEAGATVVLRADPMNQPPPFSNYIWTKDGAVIPGATSAELSLSAFAARDAGQYTVTYTDSWGQTVDSTAFDVFLYRQIGPPVHAWLTPETAFVKSGSRVTLTIGGVAGYRGLRYRWQVTGVHIPTLNRDEIDLTSLTIDLPTAPDLVGVSVTLDPILNAFPLSSRIDVRDEAPPAPPYNTRHGGPVALALGETGTFLAEAAGVSTTIWTKDDVVLGQTSSSLTIVNARQADAGTYRAKTPTGTTLGTWPLSIIEPLFIATQPASTPLIDGVAQLSVLLNDRNPSGYPVTWLLNGTEFWSDRGSTGYGNTLATHVPGTYRARVYTTEGILESEPAIVSAPEKAVPMVVRPGVYLDGRGAIYVRPDRTAVVAANNDGATVGWFGTATIATDGSFTIPQAQRVVADDQLMVMDDRLPFSGRFLNSAEIYAYCGPLAGQTIDATLPPGTERGREGFYRGVIPGTPGGEIWVFVAADNSVRVFVRDGYAIYPSGASNVTFSADGSSVTYGTFPFGPFVALRETTETTGTDAQLVNLSVRAMAGTGDGTLITGLVISGTKPRSILIRAIGPGLVDQGVPHALTDPELRLYHDSMVVAANGDWGENAAALSAAFTRLGAFSLAAGSRDAALLVTLAPGVYSSHVGLPAGASPGEVLVEAYDAGTDSSARMVNLSSRVVVPSGEIAILGFVVTGTRPKRMLVRAVGPGLESLGVNDRLTNPRLRVFKGSARTLENDDWSADYSATGRLSTIASQIGAFPLSVGSRDAVVEAEFAPGLYSAHVSGGTATDTGVALIEVYEVP